MNIRVAKPEDAEELLNIYKYYVENTTITFEYDTPSVEEFKNRIKISKKINYDLNYFEITLNILNHKNRKNPSFFLFFH